MPPSPAAPSGPDLKRQRTILIAVIVALLFMAVLVLTAVPRLPWAARIFVAAINLLGAAVLGLAIRQKFSGGPK